MPVMNELVIANNTIQNSSGDGIDLQAGGTALQDAEITQDLLRHTSGFINAALRRVLPLIEPTRYDKTLRQFPNYKDLWG